MKGNKICPACGHEMILIGFGLRMATSLHWTCIHCRNMVDYSSQQASKLQEVKK